MNQSITIDKWVGSYVRLRDKIKEIETRHKEELKPYKETLEQLNGLLLGHLNQVGGNSVSTDFGTVYRTEKKSASLADADAYMRHVIGTQSWDLMDRKANSTAVEDFIKENGSPPPGVNFSVTHVVGVRRK